MGTELTPELIRGTFALYAPLHAGETDEGLTVTRDQSYGPHERHRLDVYAPAEADRSQPVLDGREVPVLAAYAELEPDVILEQPRRRIDGLAARDGRLPLVASAPGHNHISIVEHIGTSDEALARDILGFIELLALGHEHR